MKVITKQKNYEHKVVYISIPPTDYEVLERAARENCRTIGRELLFTWREANKLTKEGLK